MAAYLAFDGEPDLRFTITQLHRRGVAVALPTVPGSDEGTLNFVSWTPATPLQPNRFGISEPRGMEAVKLADVDIVLLPLVAFDDQGGRLGMGAGWYDRALAAEDVGALRVGVGWSVQQAEDLPRDPWDVPLDAVVTEQGWFTCPDRTAKIASPSPGKTGVTE